jgi:hypothetical protein
MVLIAATATIRHFSRPSMKDIFGGFRLVDTAIISANRRPYDGPVPCRWLINDYLTMFPGWVRTLAGFWVPAFAGMTNPCFWD